MSIKWDPNVIKIIEDAAFAGLEEAGLLLEKTANDMILDPKKTGAVYDTNFMTVGSGAGRFVVPYGHREPHQASAPGEAPANDSGQLVSSSVVERNREEMLVTVKWTAPHASYMQWGTDKIAPRPFATLALGEIAGILPETVSARMRERL